MSSPSISLTFLNRNELWDDVLIFGCRYFGAAGYSALDLADDGQAVDIMAVLSTVIDPVSII